MRTINFFRSNFAQKCKKKEKEKNIKIQALKRYKNTF